MTLWDDGFNYLKHERASQRMEEEFGHERVPGKHAKRDREKQPAFPREKLSADEAQEQKRTGLSKDERVAQITALYRGADSGPALKAALEDAGYVLAKGERGYLVVDPSGGQSVLTRNTGLNKKELEAFMKGVPLDSLPSVEEAKAIQKGRAEKTGAPVEVPAPATTTEKPTPAPVPPAEEKGVEASKFMKPRATAEPAQPAPKPQDPELTALLKSLDERQEQEAFDRRDAHARELEQAERALDFDLKEKLESFEAIQQEQRKALKERQTVKREGIGGLIDAAKKRLSPAQAAQEERQKRRESQQLERRLEKERKDYLALLQKTRALEIENLSERHAQELRDLETRNNEERDRYIREHEEAKRLLAELEEQRRREELERGGPEPPKWSK